MQCRLDSAQRLHTSVTMRHIMDSLRELQTLQLKGASESDSNQSAVGRLRKEIPEPILAHFDRFVARGKKGLAIARNGVCSECHLQIPSGTLATLSCASDVHLCDNCGRYLYLPEAVPVEPILPRPAKSPQGRKKASATLRH